MDMSILKFLRPFQFFSISIFSGAERTGIYLGIEKNEIQNNHHTMRMNPKIKLALLSLALGGISFQTSGIPARPGMNKIYLADGTTVEARIMGDENFHYYMSADGLPLIPDNGRLCVAALDKNGRAISSGIDATTADKSHVMTPELRTKIISALRNGARPGLRAPKGPGLFPGNRFPTSGQQKAIVVLVEYQDVAFTQENPREYFDNMLNQPGFSGNGATGSAGDFFRECSSGLFEPEFDVYGPIRLSHDMSYYGAHFFSQDRFPYKMAIEACDQLDETVDFTQYDRDGDGEIDNVFIFYAGMGEATGGGSDAVWPHSSFVTAFESREYIYDGVRLNQYGCTNEIVDGHTDGVGTFVHEFSHILGLPDLYSTNYSGSFTSGSWSTMDMGPYNNEGRTPPCYGAFERYALGWMEPTVINGAIDAMLNPISDNTAYIVKATPDGNEYFLFENRQQYGWDTFIPGHGLLVWHIDYDDAIWSNNVVNVDNDHLYCDLIEADNKRTDGSRDGDAFPGSANVTEFTFDTTPAFAPWSGEDLGLPVTHISENDGIIRFRVKEGSFVMPVPEPLEADAVTSVGFRARWNKVADGAGYILNVYKKDSDENIASATLGDVDSHEVDGLEFDTEYAYEVIAVSIHGITSEPSSRMTARTLPPTFEYLPATALEPQVYEDGTWDARWQTMDEADNYELQVYSKLRGNPYVDACGFDGGISELPEGWSAAGCLGLSNASYAGEAVPAVKVSNGDAFIETPVYDDNISAVSFWQRGISAPEGARVVVSGLSDGRWTDLEDTKVTNAAGGSVVTFDNLPEGICGLRISYSGEKGAVAIDDITVSHGYEISIVPLSGYETRLTGNTDRLHVAADARLTDYFYKVTALSGSLRSLPSAEIAVPALSGLTAPSVTASWSADGNRLTLNGALGDAYVVADIAGHVLASGHFNVGTAVSITLPGRGFYIIRIAQSSYQVIL